MLIRAIEDPDPVLFLEHKKTYRLIKGEVPDDRYTVPFGVADVRRRGGESNLCVVWVDVASVPGGGRTACGRGH